jgi:hypothetical protein
LAAPNGVNVNLAPAMSAARSSQRGRELEADDRRRVGKAEDAFTEAGEAGRVITDARGCMHPPDQ